MYTSNNLIIMMQDLAVFINSKTNKIIFLLSIIIAVIWVLGKTINIYHFAVVGAIYEMLWLLMIVSIPVLTILATRYWIKDKFNFRSLNLYSLLLIITTILFTIFK